MMAPELFTRDPENDGVRYLELKSNDAVSRHAYKKAGTR